MIINEESLLQKIFELEVDTELYSLVYDEKGQLNLSAAIDGTVLFFYKNYDVMRHAKAFAYAHYSDSEKIFLYGLGLGYHVKEFLSLLKPGQKLYVFESNLTVVKIAFNYTDIFEHLNDPRIYFYWYENGKLVDFPADTLIVHEPSAKLAGVPFLKENHQYDISKIDLNRLREKLNISPLPKSYNICIIKYWIDDLTIMAFIKNLAIGFELLGGTCEFIEEEALFERITQNPESLTCDFILTFSMCGTRYGGKTIDAFTAIPVISVNMDHPYWFLGPEMTFDGNIIQTWNDRDDLFYSKKFYCKAGRHEFLPHGAEIDFDFGRINQNRHIGVVVSGNVQNMNLPDMLTADMSDKVFAIVNEIAQYSLQHFNRSLENCIRDVMAKKGINCNDEMLEAIMKSAGVEIDAYRRNEKKIRVVKSILEAGIEVNCFGNGWDNTELISNPLFTYYGCIQYDEGRRLMEYAKIVVNIMPTFLDGSHERVFSSMMRGALCMTEPSIYFEQEFTDGQDVVYYDYDALDDLARKIKFFLSNEEERLKITTSAFEKVKNKHTWAHRAKDVIEFYEKFTK